MQRDKSKLPGHRLSRSLWMSAGLGVLLSYYSYNTLYYTVYNYDHVYYPYFYNEVYHYYHTYMPEFQYTNYYLFLLIILLLVGFIVGKVAVARTWGFVTGMLSWMLSEAIIMISLGLQFGFHASDIQEFAVPGVGFGIIAGSITLFGAWIATRKHPYYKG